MKVTILTPLSTLLGFIFTSVACVSSGGADVPTVSINDLVGYHLTLPRNERMPRSVLVVPDCSACTITTKGEFKLPFGSNADMVLTRDPQALAHYAKTKLGQGHKLRIDEASQVLPAWSYDLAPFMLKVDRNGVIVSVGAWD